MGCCNCDCSPCGAFGDKSWQTCKVVELYVCSHPTCDFRSLDLHEVKRHKDKEAHRSDCEDESPPNKRRKTDSPAVPENCQVILNKLEQILGRSPTKKSTAGADLEEVGNDRAALKKSGDFAGEQAEFEGTRSNGAPLENVPADGAGSEHSRRRSGLEGRLFGLTSISVTSVAESHAPAPESDKPDKISSAGVPPQSEISYRITIDESESDSIATDVAGSAEIQEEGEPKNTLNSEAVVDEAGDYGSDGGSFNDDNYDDIDTCEEEEEDYVMDDNDVFDDEEVMDTTSTVDILKGAELKGFFKCEVTGCDHKARDPPELLIHEREVHFKWAHDPCAGNIAKALKELTRYKTSKPKVKFPQFVPKLVCGICKKNFSDHEEATLHVIDEHGLEGLDQVKCTSCSFTAAHPITLVRHFKADHIKTKTDEEMKVIMQKREEEKAKVKKTMYPCDICDKSWSGGFYSEAALLEHKRKRHNVSVPKTWQLCVTCGKTVKNTPDALNHHRKKYHPKEHKEHLKNKGERRTGEFSCDKCSYTSDSEYNLKRHKWVHGPKEVCEICGVTVHKSHKWKHLETAHAKLACKKCGLELEGFANLKVHMIKVHREICDDCGMPLGKDESLEDKNHRCAATKGGGRPPADLMTVGKKVKTFRDFIRVMPDRSFLCFECGFRATSEHLMVRHDSTVHRNIVCSLCSRNCFGRAELVQHMKALHPQACINCGGDKTESQHNCAKVLSTDDSFTRHIPVKYRPVYCRACFELVQYGKPYREHMKKEHGVVVEALKAKPRRSQSVLAQTGKGRNSISMNNVDTYKDQDNFL